MIYRFSWLRFSQPGKAESSVELETLWFQILTALLVVIKSCSLVTRRRSAAPLVWKKETPSPRKTIILFRDEIRKRVEDETKNIKKSRRRPSA